MDFIKEENFLGYIYFIDYNEIHTYLFEAYKQKNGGVPENSLLFVKNKLNEDIIVARVRNLSRNLPNKKEAITKLTEAYSSQENIEDIDIDLRKNLDVTGYDCEILGTLYQEDGAYKFGSDLHDFFSPHNYTVYKPTNEALDFIIKATGGLEKETNLEEYGVIRYASTRFNREDSVPFYIKPLDILAKRVALFGMTRTGKSNSMKNLVCTVNKMRENKENILYKNKPITNIGQIIFDINGEYANKNVQDGTSIKEKFGNNVQLYGFLKRDGFETMKINFYDEAEGGLQEGFNLIRAYFEESQKGAEYFQNFLSVDWSKPEAGDNSALVRYKRRVALYKCILYKARFDLGPQKEMECIEFELSKELREVLNVGNQSRWTPEKAIDIFMKIWAMYETHPYFELYKEKNNGREWIDPELKALFPMLTRNKNYGAEGSLNSYIKLSQLLDYHSIESEELFTEKIVDDLERGYIIIVDLSMGPEEVKKLYSEKLARHIFDHNKEKFIKNQTPVHIQMYFEEAHNLFPKGGEDLTQIYNRLAKEGAKYHIGLVYATQEPSSISPNILKNTENWFISHLNNEAELATLSSYNDFGIYKEQLKKFSLNDVGYSRIKMYSYPFTYPVQINLFK